MHPGLFTIPARSALGDVAAALVEHRVHMLVVDDGGIVDDLAVARAAADGLDVPETTAIERIGAHETLAAAAARMAGTGATHLLVMVTGGERPAGVLSAWDVVEVLAVA